MNPIGWFEIPVKEMDRSIRFYSNVFGHELHAMDMGVLKMAVFPSDQAAHGSSGALVQHKEFYFPSDQAGVLIYFSCADVKETLKKVVENGGKVVVEKKQISEEQGFMGIFIDSEGNRIALHSFA